MYKLIYLIVFSPLVAIAQITTQAQATPQVGIHGDVYIASGVDVVVYSPSTTFVKGVIKSRDDNPGSIIFNANNIGTGASADAHVEAFVTSIETPNFTFPVGDEGVYQPLRTEEGDKSTLKVNFQLKKHSNETLPTGIDKISSRFYWETKGTRKAKLSLSWNMFSDIDVLTDRVESLEIVGFNGIEWERIISVLAPFSFNSSSQTPSSLTEGSISTTEAIDFSKYEAFTLATTRLKTDIFVSQALTPNGDGINDVWYIKNIELYPNARIRVYNRWGAEVYSVLNYKNDWGGTYKDNTDYLPSSSYYYIIDIENDGKIDLQGWIYLTK